MVILRRETGIYTPTFVCRSVIVVVRAVAAPVSHAVLSHLGLSIVYHVVVRSVHRIARESAPASVCLTSRCWRGTYMHRRLLVHHGSLSTVIGTVLRGASVD